MYETYVNPVYVHSFPDPFVLKYRAEYWAYCTGEWHDGRYFGVLHSRDLVQWHPLGGAMAPLPGGYTHYWAPEVTYDNGRFYMYYSVGNEEYMQIRVAIAEHPAGPFVDSGRRLTSEPFAIDAHVFADDNGECYLFYATDFLEHSHAGTGTTRDGLLDPLTLAGQPQPVTRPRYDWHVYDPHRIEKGGVRWHTVEGPFVLKHKRRYYQMFSGGNWQNISYGVSYALSDSVDSPGEWTQVADGEQVLPILRTLPGKVVGPGHNSVVRGPDNRQLFCVYHRWVDAARMLAIDRLEWAGERMLVLGPSTTPQPAPLAPTFADFFDERCDDGLGRGWECISGRWSAHDGAAIQATTDSVAIAQRKIAAESFTAEITMRQLDDPRGGSYGLALDNQLFVLLAPARDRLTIRARRGERWIEHQRALPAEFDARADHLLSLEVDAGRVAVALDSVALPWTGPLAGDQPVGAIGLVAEQVAVAFAGFALTVGWQDLFTELNARPADLGWQTQDTEGWSLAEQQLRFAGQLQSSIAKGPLLADYELVVNARLERQNGPAGCYGFYPTLHPTQPSALLTVETIEGSWAIRCQQPAGEHILRLPANFDPTIYQQFRFRKQGGRLAIDWEALALGEIAVPLEPTGVQLYGHAAIIAFDMVRVTAIGQPDG
jgi:GH43 family beta-xylosidase